MNLSADARSTSRSKKLVASAAGAGIPSRATRCGSASRWSKASASASRRSRACASPARTPAINSNFTLRKISYGEGVERIFPLYSPRITAIEVVRRGAVRRAKLYYLRGLHRQGGAHRRARARQRAPGADAGQDRRRRRIDRREYATWPQPRTLFDKIWDSHLVDPQDEGTCLIYIDRHLVHEVTSPQAFEGLRSPGARCAGRTDARRRRPQRADDRPQRRRPGIDEPESQLQVETLERNVKEFGVPYFAIDHPRQGIVHVIGPEQGLTQPGMTIVCGDSHTATHGAFGALAFGIGTSEVEHVLATQTLIQRRPRTC